MGMELATCVKYGIGLNVVVFDDGHLNMVRQGARRVLGSGDDFQLPVVDFVAWGRSLGCETHRLTDAEDFALLSRPARGPRLIIVPIDAQANLRNARERVFNFPEES